MCFSHFFLTHSLLIVFSFLSLMTSYISCNNDELQEQAYENYKKHLKVTIGDEDLAECVVDILKSEDIALRFSTETLSNEDKLFKNFDVFLEVAKEKCWPDTSSTPKSTQTTTKTSTINYHTTSRESDDRDMSLTTIKPKNNNLTIHKSWSIWVLMMFAAVQIFSHKLSSS